MEMRRGFCERIMTQGYKQQRWYFFVE